MRQGKRRGRPWGANLLAIREQDIRAAACIYFIDWRVILFWDRCSTVVLDFIRFVGKYSGED
jgi:hypothetical protein